ncbi:bifunctional phosphopantothenoylcysteine decarboxylase/phosphopantothenate synthase, partial [Pasteurella multocida subsp. multocida str. Anand1_cattle]
VGITGGIAAYKSIELIRLLRKNQADVRVVLTPAAAEFVTPLTLQAISRQCRGSVSLGSPS